MYIKNIIDIVRKRQGDLANFTNTEISPKIITDIMN